MHLALRADGGSEIGYGHLVRSSALVGEFFDRNHRVTIATTTPENAKSVFPDAVETVSLPSRDDPEPFVQWIEASDPDVVFTDAYPVDTSYQREIRAHATLAVLQDDARHAVCADVFANGNLYATDLEYEFVGRKPQLCLGPAYVLLRREVRERVRDEPPWREQPERAIVTMGGSDMAGKTPAALRAFDGFDIAVDAIIGPGFSDEQAHRIREVAEEISPDVRVARDPVDLVERMFQADFAVSTASSTTYELLGLGTPIVSVPIADNQEPIARALRERDAAAVLQRDAGTDAFRKGIEEYISSSRLRRERRDCGRSIVDANGASRVVNTIEKLIAT